VTDPYFILGVLRTATALEIRKAYRRKVLAMHPDHNKAQGAEAAFCVVQTAYDALKTPEARKATDDRLEWQKLLDQLRLVQTRTPPKPTPRPVPTTAIGWCALASERLPVEDRLKCMAFGALFDLGVAVGRSFLA
jgi:curved DNA-binding protein CbpA